ncbi:MAG: CHAT domain-containing tetratricopeptide repeat protein [Bacteroidota bacterium]
MKHPLFSRKLFLIIALLSIVSICVAQINENDPSRFKNKNNTPEINFENCLINSNAKIIDTLEISYHFKAIYNLIDSAHYDSASQYSDCLLTNIPADLLRYNNFIAELNYLKGRCAEELSNYKQAKKHYRKNLAMRLNAPEGDSLKIAIGYNSLGIIYCKLGNYDTSLTLIKKALTIRTNNLGPNTAPVASSYNNMGFVATYSGNYEKALIYYKKALDIHLISEGENNIQAADFYNNIGSIYYYTGQYDEAIDYFLKGLNISKNLLGNTHPIVTGYYSNLGSVNFSRGNYAEAQEYFSLDLEHLKLQFNKDHIYISDALNNIANSLSEQGNFNKAIIYYERALIIREKKLGSFHPAVAEIHSNLARTYVINKNLPKAIFHSKKAHAIKSGTIGESHVESIKGTGLIGEVYTESCQFDSATYYLNRTKDLAIKYMPDNFNLIASAYFLLGKLYFTSEDLKKSKKYLHQSIQTSRKASSIHSRNFAISHIYLSRAYEKEQDLESSLIHLDTVFSILNFDPNAHSVQSFHSIPVFSEAIFRKGKILKKKFVKTNEDRLLERSNHYFKININTFDSIRKLMIYPESLTKHIDIGYRNFDGLINNNFILGQKKHDKKKYIESAFNASEKYKSFIMLHSMYESFARQFGGIPDSLIKTEHAIKTDITFYEKSILQAQNQNNSNDSLLNQITVKLFDLKQEHEYLISSLEKKYPNYFALKYKSGTCSITELQDSILAPGQALLEYFTGDSSIYLFLIKKGQEPKLVEIKKDFPLEEWVKNFQQSLAGTNRTRQYVEYGQKLYDKLILPVAHWLPERVVVVPDNVLGYVPFGALLSGPPIDLRNFRTYPFLINKHQFSYCYSATLLKEMKEKKHFREPEKLFAAFAPAYDGDTTLLAGRFVNASNIPKGFPPLSFAEKEVNNVFETMRDGDLFTGRAAIKDTFTAVAGNYRHLHLSTHAWADNRVGDYAFLAFSQQREKKDDGLLFIRDLYNLQLNADLVVLSACNTAIGKLRRGEGIISLARAFAYAGSKSLLTTLWEVNDQSTSELMGYFYEHLTKGRSKDAAINQAQNDFLRRKDKPNHLLHPYYWSPFLTFGDMSAIDLSKLSNN